MYYDSGQRSRFSGRFTAFLNKEEFAEEKTAGIGIQNVWKRIKIRYEEKATILYSNSNGACVEMYLPYEKY